MMFKLSFIKERWVVAIKGGGEFSTPSLDLALLFIKTYAEQMGVCKP